MIALITRNAEELSRRAMLLLEQADADLASLEADPACYSVARFHELRQAIINHRAWLQTQYQREKATTK